MDPAPKQLTIHLGRVLDIVGLGIRRASSFMALGVRASEDETVDSVLLDASFSIEFMPRDMPTETIRNHQRNFRTWVIGNGLRELDQVTSIFADSVFEVRTIAQFHNRSITQEALDQIAEFKKRTNVAEKLRLIAEQFGLDTDLRVHMRGLSKARNALTHNMGIVAEQHTTHDGELQMSWIGPEIAVGDHVLAGDFQTPVRVEAGTLVTFRFGPRNRTVLVGAPIELSPHDLQEICFTYWIQAQTLVTKLGGQLAELGIGPVMPESQTPASLSNAEGAI